MARVTLPAEPTVLIEPVGTARVYIGGSRAPLTAGRRFPLPKSHAERLIELGHAKAADLPKLA
jgi:hypothetical protein